MITTFGDSHSWFLFGDVPAIDANHIGPVTMHRVGRDDAWFIRDHDIPAGHLVLCVFGEIDVRCHVGKIADREGVSRLAVVEDLVRRYLRAIRGRWPGRLAVMGVLPPASNETIMNQDYPWYGSWSDRIVIRRAVNAELLRQCAPLGIAYLDVPQIYAGPEGGLDHRFSDGHVHIDRRFRWPMLKNLEALSGIPLSWE